MELEKERYFFAGDNNKEIVDALQLEANATD
jgi:hypothetical protein